MGGDFVDEGGRMSNQTRWFNSRKEVWWSIHKYMNGAIKVIGSMLSREMMGKLRQSCELFGNEMSNRMSPLKDVQGAIFFGVGNMAQAVESKITENEERGISKNNFRPHRMMNYVK